MHKPTSQGRQPVHGVVPRSGQVGQCCSLVTLLMKSLGGESRAAAAAHPGGVWQRVRPVPLPASDKMMNKGRQCTHHVSGGWKSLWLQKACFYHSHLDANQDLRRSLLYFNRFWSFWVLLYWLWSSLVWESVTSSMRISYPIELMATCHYWDLWWRGGRKRIPISKKLICNI